MDKPKIAATEPKAVELEEGKKYAFCTCGLSDTQPFCNGAHKGTDFVPHVFTAEETKTAHLCQCKQTKNTPFCDGSHSQIGKPKIG
jgi:CDGSH-type Zn-finger protein